MNTVLVVFECQCLYVLMLFWSADFKTASKDFVWEDLLMKSACERKTQYSQNLLHI